MAIWQVSIHLIAETNREFSNDKFIFNKNYRVNPSSTNMLIGLPKEKSWTNSIEQYGSLDKTCLEIIYDEKIISDIHLRLSVYDYKEKPEIVRGIENFCKVNKLSLYYEKEVFPPSFECITQIVEQSDAFRFVKNPQRYMNNID